MDTTPAGLDSGVPHHTTNELRDVNAMRICPSSRSAVVAVALVVARTEISGGNGKGSGTEDAAQQQRTDAIMRISLRIIVAGHTVTSTTTTG